MKDQRNLETVCGTQTKPGRNAASFERKKSHSVVIKAPNIKTERVENNYSYKTLPLTHNFRSSQSFICFSESGGII